MQGITGKFDYKKILKALKKEYCCNGTVVDDDELGQVIQVQGDQRKNIADFLTTNKIVKKDNVRCFLASVSSSPPVLCILLVHFELTGCCSRFFAALPSF